MMADHLLIRRPLIEAYGQFVCGFDNELVNELLNNKDVSHLQNFQTYLTVNHVIDRTFKIFLKIKINC